VQLPFLLIDTNIMGIVRSSPSAYKNLMNSLGKSFATARFNLIATPFSILEASGVKPPKFSIKISETSLRNLTVNERFETLFSGALATLKNQPELQSNSLLACARQQLDFYTCPIAQPFFDELVVKRIKTPNFESELQVSLALDYVYKFDFPKDIQNEMHCAFLIDLLRAPNSKINPGMFRAMSILWKEFSPTLLRNSWLSKNYHDYLIKVSALKKNGDYLDSEFIHYVCAGFFHDRSFKKVIGLTADPKDAVVKRCGMHLMLLKAAWDMINAIRQREKFELPFTQYQFAPGLVGICSQDGRIVDLLSTKRLPRRVFTSF
jgi:hypothetical protein